MKSYKYKPDYASSLLAKKYEDKGLMLYALALQEEIDDIDTLASTSLTDNFDDKGIDVLHFIPERKIAILIQGYMAKDETKPEAKSSKAANFNTAITWALSQPLGKIPPTIRDHVKELRKAINDGDVDKIIFWYVHNLDESKNVKEELNAVESTAKSFLETHFKGKKVLVSSLEVGNETLEKWYKTKTQTILVDDILETKVEQGGYEISGKGWKAFHTTVSLRWLKEIYDAYKDDLFSANIRDYLGNVEINNAIKQTCTTEPGNFWIYNNGITCLVHKFDYDEGEKKIKLTGISIINGAQTTGAVGAATMADNEGHLPIRFVTLDKADTWRNMILYNNSQNRIFSYDFRSNDEVQKRLRDEFKLIPDTDYTGRRGGTEDIIRRPTNLIRTEKAAISFVAFCGDPYLTYHKKKEIWDDYNYYKYYDSDLTAKHLVFTYSLLVAIEKKKRELRKIFDQGKLTDLQEKEYEFLKRRGGMRLYLSAIGYSIEEILGQKITNTKRLSFGNKSWADSVEIWKDVVDKTIMYCPKLLPGVENGILNKEGVEKALSEFRSSIASQVAGEKAMYDTFKDKIVGLS